LDYPGGDREIGQRKLLDRLAAVDRPGKNVAVGKRLDVLRAAGADDSGGQVGEHVRVLHTQPQVLDPCFFKLLKPTRDTPSL
jgi:hypothetical protein